MTTRPHLISGCKEDEKMELFVCLTEYHALSASALVLSRPGIEAEILLTSLNGSLGPLKLRLEESKIFRAVYFISENECWSFLKDIDTNSTKEQITAAAEKIHRFYQKALPNDFGIYDDIHIWCDHFTVGFALAFVHMPYRYYEESGGCHHRRDVFIKLSKSGITNKAFAPLCEYYGLRGQYPYATAYCYDFEINPMPRTSKDVDFSLLTLLRKLKQADEASFGRLKETFMPGGYVESYGAYDPRKENFVLLGQHYSAKIYENAYGVRYALALLADYFGENMNLIFKKHPTDLFNPLKSWFNNATFLSTHTPIELIIADDAIRIARAAAISSSAALSYEKAGVESIVFHNTETTDSFESERRFLDFHRYFIAVKIAETLKKFSEQIYVYGTETRLLELLFKYQSKIRPQITPLKNLIIPRKTDKPSLTIFDRIVDSSSDLDYRQYIGGMLEKIGENEIVIFLDGNGLYEYFDIYGGMTEHLLPLPIDITETKNDRHFFGNGTPTPPLKNSSPTPTPASADGINAERQVIYLFAKSNDVKQSALAMNVRKLLDNCGLSVTFDPLSLNYREIVLESTLKQMESQYLELTLKDNLSQNIGPRIIQSNEALVKINETLVKSDNDVRVVLDKLSGEITALSQAAEKVQACHGQSEISQALHNTALVVDNMQKQLDFLCNFLCGKTNEIDQRTDNISGQISGIDKPDFLSRVFRKLKKYNNRRGK